MESLGIEALLHRRCWLSSRTVLFAPESIPQGGGGPSRGAAGGRPKVHRVVVDRELARMIEGSNGPFRAMLPSFHRTLN